MFWNAKFGTVPIADASLEYLRFGRGTRILVMLPGLGDSLRSMKGTQLPVAMAYGMFAGDFTVYVFGRRYPMEQGFTTAQMAQDLHMAMETLGIQKADLMGVSMGGMIAQYFAAAFPERVNKLVLAVTAAGTNTVMEEAIAEWVALAKKGDHAAFMESNFLRIYSLAYCRKNKWMIPLLGKLTKPKSYTSFLIQAQACLAHDAYDLLPAIQAPTLVVGGEKDLALGGDPSRQIAASIPNARLLMYDQWGHGLYEEAKDFNSMVLRFLKE